MFNSDIKGLHVRDLNFVLRFEIFVNSNGQLRASHLTLGCTPVYKTWQPFSQALLVDSLLLLYIDARHANVLPPQLIIGETRDLEPQYTTAEDLALVRDTSAKLVSQSCRVHVYVREPEASVQVVKPAVAESVNSSEAEANQSEEMVTRRTMIVDRFLPDTRPVTQPHQPQGKGWTPPLPVGYAKKM